MIGYDFRRLCVVYFEPTDIAVAREPFATDTWKGLSFISPNLKELQEIANALQREFHSLFWYNKTFTEVFV